MPFLSTTKGIGMQNLKIAVAQIPSLKGDVSANIKSHLLAIEKAAKACVSYLVFPELSLTGYELELASELAFTIDDKRLLPLIESAIKYAICIAVGVPLFVNNAIHIAVIIISDLGDVNSYSKMHLHAGEETFIVEGTSHYLTKVQSSHGELNIANAICADIIHPIHVQTCYELGANIYMAGVLIGQRGYAGDVRFLEGYSRDFNMLIAMANHNQPTGAWSPIGKSAIWFAGKLLACANETEDALVVAEKKGRHWVGYVVEL